jgi:dihydrofolate synthase / folylpolyglutamate synthase
MPEVAYADALALLASSSQRGMRLGLETTRALLAALDNPQAGLRGALVAGTNGKGSVCAIAAEIAEHAGYRVALLTKPHLTSYRERIRIGGEFITEDRFTDLVTEVLRAAGRMGPSAGLPTHHELLTAMGFLAARESDAEITFCEVGLGGRLDATNVWDGGVAVVTSIGLDHQAQLGNTIPEIAGEKAAIIKPGNLVVSGVSAEALPVVEEAARRVGARLWQLGDQLQVAARYHANQDQVELDVTTPKRSLRGLRLGLAGAYQLPNAAVAVAVADCLNELGFEIGDNAIRAGLATVRWPGRLESVGSEPEVIVDAAHNPAAVSALLPDLQKRVLERASILLFGSMRDHDHRAMLQLLAGAGFRQAVLTSSRSGRAVPASELSGEWPGEAELVEPSGAALSRAAQLAGEHGQVVALGSIYLIGEVLAGLGIGLPPDPEVPFQPLW